MEKDEGLIEPLIPYSQNTRDTIIRLNRIGIALTSEHDLDKLLNLIVSEARLFTKSDAGSLYLVEGNLLHFCVVQNDTLTDRGLGGEPFKSILLPLTRESIAGYVAATGQVANIEDVYNIDPRKEYKFNPALDLKFNYRTRSLLGVPMIDPQGEIIGVIQLINSLDPSGQVVPYHRDFEELLLSLASQAAVAVRNARFIEEIKAIFEAFVKYSAAAIDIRSRHTGGHSERVAELSVRLAKAINDKKDGHFASINFDDQELVELRYAGWLHDIGKIGVREKVLEKSQRLPEGRIEVIMARFEAMKKDIICNWAFEKANQLDETPLQNLQMAMAGDQGLCNQLKKLEEELDLIKKVNLQNNITPIQIEKLRQIATRTFQSSSGAQSPLLNEEEIGCLTIPRGNLTPQEYKQIQDHVTLTVEILEKIPFPKYLKNIPLYAAGHHEMLSGEGYPKGLKDAEIPLRARILALADIFDALTAADRPYKPAVPLERALEILRENAKNGRLDPEIVDLFIEEKLYLKD